MMRQPPSNSLQPFTDMSSEETIERDSRLGYLMSMKMEVWDGLYQLFHRLVSNPTINEIAAGTSELVQMKDHLQQINEVLQYVRSKRADNSFTWKACMLVDEDLKTRFNLMNILLSKLKLSSD